MHKIYRFYKRHTNAPSIITIVLLPFLLVMAIGEAVYREGIFLKNALAWLVVGKVETLSRITQKTPRDPSYATYYTQNVTPLEEQFEKNRIDALKTFRRRFPIAIILMTVVGVSFIEIRSLLENAPDIIVLFVSLAFLVIEARIALYATSQIRHYKKKVKSIILPKLVAFFEEKFTYSEKSDFPHDKIRESQLYPSNADIETEDQLIGNRKGIKIHWSEVTISKRMGNQRREYFDGVMILLDIKKHFTGITLVQRNKQILQKGDLQRVELEDARFEKRFDVYADNQIEARYILTPSVMERFLALGEIFKENTIKASFFNNQLLITIYSDHDYFEAASIFSPSCFANDADIIFDVVQQIRNIIDILKLDQEVRV